MFHPPSWILAILFMGPGGTALKSPPGLRSPHRVRMPQFLRKAATTPRPRGPSTTRSSAGCAPRGLALETGRPVPNVGYRLSFSRSPSSAILSTGGPSFVFCLKPPKKRYSLSQRASQLFTLKPAPPTEQGHNLPQKKRQKPAL